MTTAWAQDYLGQGLDQARNPATPVEFSLLSSLASAAGALLLVLALIYAVFYVLRRWGVRRGWVLPAAGRSLRVLGSHSLDGRKTLYLVQVGGAVLVVGAGHSELNLIHAIQDPKEVERIRADLGFAEGEGPSAFEGALASAFVKEAGAQDLKAGRESISRARDALKKVFERLGGGKP